MPDPKCTETYRVVAQRLRSFRPMIVIEDHIEAGSLTVETSTLGGINFKPKDFHRIWEAFRNAKNEQGEQAFDYYPLRPDKLKHFLKSAFSLDLLDISYLATKGFGFREIRDVLQLDGRPLSISDARPGRVAPLWDRRFGARFGVAGTGNGRMDYTSVHAALSEQACNVHIDDMGFVLRGWDGSGGMSPDFLQHLIDELLWKTFAAPEVSRWLGDHLTINLPSSRTGYAPMLGLTLDLPEEGLSVSATVTFKCKCLPAGQAEIDHLPDGFSFGVGLTKRMDWLGGGRPDPRTRRR
jgi:hypothetical protein